MLNLKRGDTAVGLSFTIMTKNFKGINLTNTVVKFNLLNEKNETIISRDAIVTSPTEGKITFYFTPNEINITGNMKGEIEVIYPDGLIETFPNSGYIPIQINDRLNPFYPPSDNTPPIITATPGGSFNNYITIVLESNEDSVKIYYTLDGTNPDEYKSPIYSGPINVYETKTFKFFGKDMYGNKTNIQTIVYNIGYVIINGGLFTTTSFSDTVTGGEFLTIPTEVLSGGIFKDNTNNNDAVDGGGFLTDTADTIDGGTF